MASSDGPLDRRRFLRGLGLGGVAGLAGITAGQQVARGQEGQVGYDGAVGSSEVHDLPETLYGGLHDPPDGIAASALDAITIPPSPSSGPVDLEWDVVARPVAISAGATIDAWTYAGTVPGPTVRITEGERLRVRLRNQTQHPHSLHFHGRHAPAMDGWQPIPPGGEFTYEIEAGPAGLHPYHCHTAPLAEHIRRGLYGALIVDPVGGRPPAQERLLVLGGFDVAGVTNAVVAWNGLAGFHRRFPIKVEAGEPVRVHVVNMVESEPVASFHLHAQVFGVIPGGMGDEPAWLADVVTLSQGERAILEFDLPETGRYMFHPHQHHLAMRGAMGWFAAV